MTQLFFREFASQLWRLNSITKLEEINFCLSCHFHWKKWMLANYPPVFWQVLECCPEAARIIPILHLLRTPDLAMAAEKTSFNIFWEVTTSVMERREHRRKETPKRDHGGKNFQNVIATYRMRMGDGQCLNLLSWEKHEAGLSWLSRAGRLSHWTLKFLRPWSSLVRMFLPTDAAIVYSGP